MGLKKNHSKKLSKTIALAVMAMSVAGFASVASAEENEIVKAVFGNNATVEGQWVTCAWQKKKP